MALVTTLALGGGWYAWDNHASHVIEMATGPGEVREAELPDGTRVTLNFSSRLQVRYYPRRRETVLDQGEAFFQVAADRSRPFTVDSGASQVRVVGTAFNVRAGPPALVVKVLEGKVELRPDRHAADDRRLLLGAGAGMSVDARDGTQHPLAAGADTVGDWRSGQMVFQQATAGPGRSRSVPLPGPARTGGWRCAAGRAVRVRRGADGQARGVSALAAALVAGACAGRSAGRLADLGALSALSLFL
ncbi:FecR domain-containing protein [Delftia sp.]|uniref:FecR family protein n=1 Tax=Delftia sp. TaxID=1886637 RepID=UPI00259D023E|nr:FecR domain-containing protein [Delftia sp.]